MANINGEKPIKDITSSGSSSISDSARIKNEASELYTRLRTTGENFTRWEDPDGRHHLLKLEGNQLVYTVINQNMKPQQGKKAVYHCKFGEDGQLNEVVAKEYLHYKNEPKADITMNTAYKTLQGARERIYGSSGRTPESKDVSWQDVVAGGLPKEKQSQSQPAPQPQPQQPEPTPEPEQPQQPSTEPAPQPPTTKVEMQSVDVALRPRGKYLGEGYKHALKVNIPKGWRMKYTDINQDGFKVHSPKDEMTGYEFTNKPDGNNADEIIQNYINKLQRMGATNIKLVDEKGKPGEQSRGKKITYDLNGKNYTSVIEATGKPSVAAGLNPLSYRVSSMPFQSAFNPLLSLLFMGASFLGGGGGGIGTNPFAGRAPFGPAVGAMPFAGGGGLFGGGLSNPIMFLLPMLFNLFGGGGLQSLLYNPLTGPDPYMMQSLKDSAVRSLIVKTSPTEEEQVNGRIFEEIDKSINESYGYGAPSSGPAPQKIVIEIPGLQPPKPKEDK